MPQLALSTTCYWKVCFFPLNPEAERLFSFPEMLSGLALLVLAWTIADIRYHFRISIAPFPLRAATFYSVITISALTLMTDLWRANSWYVPIGPIFTPESWQIFLAGMLLSTFTLWSWYAFIRPPIFGKPNSLRFGQALFQHILKSAPDELPIITDELGRSAKNLVKYAPALTNSNQKQNLTKVESIANDMLSLIANKRFCRALVAHAPQTIFQIFHSISENKKYNIQIKVFGKNILNAALADTDSFIYHEENEYDSGYIGHLRPISRVIYGNFQLVDAAERLLEIDLELSEVMTNQQWKGYFRLFEITLFSYIESGCPKDSFCISGAFDTIKDSFQLKRWEAHGKTISWRDSLYYLFHCIFQFVNTVGKSVNATSLDLPLEKITQNQYSTTDLSDPLSDLFFSMIEFTTNQNYSDHRDCWRAQYGAAWGPMRTFERSHGEFGRIVLRKVRAKLHASIKELYVQPSIESAYHLGFCLNVLGLEPITGSTKIDKANRALQHVALRWTKRHFAGVAASHPQFPTAALPPSFEYDDVNHKILQKMERHGLRTTSTVKSLTLDPP
ncbi:hypothetical protein [Zhongshania sp.]|uniref:hypothetical protein n=1 Tax=Zhongshania sp. TaxID=1971902 RepID=UPI00356309FB